MSKVKRLKVFSFAKFQSLVIGLIGVVVGILYAFGGAAIDALVSLGWVTTSETPGVSYGTILAFGALIGMPVIFAIIGFALGLVEAILYNLFAKWFGCVSVGFEDEKITDK